MLREKWDWALPESLLMKSFASISLDISTAIAFAQSQSTAKQNGVATP
jgi:ATP-dependent Lhr-like helicase